ncbi:hypothetical protein [uncultured Finegoldia sp.]|uniref:hypothetical protein n=1 Tax=uncultured Finegoldia sp. TaxID=328009 RepID=UPI002628B95B|nr:hypothetical protein [uncultured Finegoldia sp.]
MIKFVVGPKGSGKTKWLIDQANDEKKNKNGNIIFVDSDDKHIFTLDHSVRLIDASTFHISNPENLYGFLAGIMSRDFDIETIYVDGIYSIVNMTDEQLHELLENLEILSKEANVNFFIGMNKDKQSLPEKYHKDTTELHA